MLPTDLSAGTLIVFRARARKPCEERAFMLAAVDISSAIGFDGLDYVVRVAEGDAAPALIHLRQYEAERVPKPPPPPAPPTLPNAWVGCVVYGITLVVIGLLISNAVWPLDAFDRGELDAAQVRSGQWWRAWTALTLHLDGAHLIANLAAGVWFGYLAAGQIGSGITWFLIVTGAAAANLTEALLGPDLHRSVGASTAVFTALGLLSAYQWRLRAPTIRQWALRWAPLVAGVVLLSWFGVGDDDPNAPATTDVVAHALGFLMGVLLGALMAQPPMRAISARIPQWLAGAAALASIAIAWGLALRA
jgi:membrane associated rhomboid family serine protease